MRVEEEERNLKKQLRVRIEMEKMINSLGFVFTKEMAKEKKRKNGDQMNVVTDLGNNSDEKGVEVPEGKNNLNLNLKE